MLWKRMAAFTVGFVALAACGGVPGVGPAKVPEFQPSNETKCAIVKSHSEPLVVEWPMSDRAKLETLKRTGLVAVQYEGCHMKLLPYCKAPGSYAYNGVTRKHDRVTIRNTSELYANLPAGAVQLEGRLAEGGELGVRMTVVGRYVADRPGLRIDELTGECKGATHVIAALTVGAFDFEAYGKAKAQGGVHAFGAGAGGSASSEKETLSTDGSETECETAKRADTEPPEGCGAPIRVEVLELAKPEEPAKAWLSGVEQLARNVQKGAESTVAVAEDLRKRLDASACPKDPQAARIMEAANEAGEGSRSSIGRAEDLRIQATKATFGSEGARAIEGSLNGLNEEVRRYRTRMALAAETLLGQLRGCAPPGNLSLKFENAIGRDFLLYRVVVVLDGQQIYSREDASARFPPAFDLYAGSIPSGDHNIAVLFGYKIAKAKKETKITLKGAHPFRVSSEESKFVTLLPSERPQSIVEERPQFKVRIDDAQGKVKETVQADTSSVTVTVAP